MNIPEWVVGLFKAVDSKDTAAFASFLTEDCSFVFGNFPVVTGKDGIRAFVDNFLGSIKNTEHTLENFWSVDGHAIVHGMVSYTRMDGTVYQVKFCNIFELAGGKVRKYDIFIDNSRLYS